MVERFQMQIKNATIQIAPVKTVTVETIVLV